MFVKLINYINCWAIRALLALKLFSKSFFFRLLLLIQEIKFVLLTDLKSIKLLILLIFSLIILIIFSLYYFPYFNNNTMNNLNNIELILTQVNSDPLNFELYNPDLVCFYIFWSIELGIAIIILFLFFSIFNSIYESYKEDKRNIKKIIPMTAILSSLPAINLIKDKDISKNPIQTDSTQVPIPSAESLVSLEQTSKYEGQKEDKEIWYESFSSTGSQTDLPEFDSAAKLAKDNRDHGYLDATTPKRRIFTYDYYLDTGDLINRLNVLLGYKPEEKPLKFRFDDLPSTSSNQQTEFRLKKPVFDPNYVPLAKFNLWEKSPSSSGSSSSSNSIYNMDKAFFLKEKNLENYITKKKEPDTKLCPDINPNLEE